LKETNEYLNESFDNEDILENNNNKKKIETDIDIKNKIENNNDNDSENKELNDIYLIDPLFIEYTKKYSDYKNTWWPVKVTYGGKKYYVASHTSYLNNPKTNVLYYFCVNHRLNTPYKKMLFGNKNYNGKLKFIRNTNEFYIIHKHNEICDIKNKKVYDNLANIEKEINNFSNYKEALISFLNKNPLIGYNAFKKKAVNIYLKNEYEFCIKKNTLTNIYYSWRNQSKIFSWTSIYDNITTQDNKFFLRDEQTSLIFDIEKKQYYWHKHILWISPIFIKALQNAQHIYIDSTFITTKDFYQLLIVMVYVSVIDKKIPCAYILMNSKSEKSYEIVLSKLNNIITQDNSLEVKILTITSDFELSLINSIHKIFKHCRHIGCLFHFIKNIRLNMLKIGLLNTNLKDISNNLLSKISSIPFLINDNPNLINDIFESSIINYKAKNGKSFI
jgi:uncharacterized protein with FMN-binding domain